MDELLIAPTATVADLASREGFDENSLGQPVFLPSLPDADTVLLPYTHFSVPMRLDKRLAAVTGLGIDGAKLMDLDRSGINWRLDPRLREDQQTGGAGLRPQRHRPRAPGPPGLRGLGRHPRRGSPGKRRHLSLHERGSAGGPVQPGPGAVAGHGDLPAGACSGNRRRLVVFTGPIFSDLDPVYRGVDIPLRYFKVAAFIHEGELAATGYVVDQTPQLAELPDVPGPGAMDEAPRWARFRTFQTPIRDIATLTGPDLDQLIEVDRMPIAATLGTARVGTTWRKLGALEDLDLDFDLED